MAAHYGDIPTGGTEIDVLPTNAAAYRVRLVVLRTRADNEILARIRTCAGSECYIAKNNIDWRGYCSIRQRRPFPCDLHRASVQERGESGQAPQGEPDLGQDPQEEPDLGQDLHTPFR